MIVSVTIGRMRDATDSRCTCTKFLVPHQAAYCAVVDRGTHVDRLELCTNAAAAWSHRHGLKFPPGFTKEQV